MNVGIKTGVSHKVQIARVIRVSASIKAATNLGLIAGGILGDS